MKFTINSKELKAAFDKVITVINKKASFTALTRINFKAAAGRLQIFGTDIDQWLVLNPEARIYEEGAAALDIEDVKMLAKLNGDINFNTCNSKVKISCNNKVLNFNAFEVLNVEIPDDAAPVVFEHKEKWMLETLENLDKYTLQDPTNKMFAAYHFNLKEGRVEALDGHRIGIRLFDRVHVLDDDKNIIVMNSFYPVIKKAANKKQDNNISIGYTDSHIIIKGSGYTYIQKKFEGTYFNINGFMNNDSNISYRLNKDSVIETMNFNIELAKAAGDKKPVILHIENDNLCSYIINKKGEALDLLPAKEINGSYTAGYNPVYLKEAFEMIDIEYPVCSTTSNKAPLIINGEEYIAAVLPVNIGEGSSRIIDNIKTLINKNVA